MGPRKYLVVDNASVNYPNIANLYFHRKPTRHGTHQSGSLITAILQDSRKNKTIQYTYR